MNIDSRARDAVMPVWWVADCDITGASEEPAFQWGKDVRGPSSSLLESVQHWGGSWCLSHPSTTRCSTFTGFLLTGRIRPCLLDYWHAWERTLIALYSPASSTVAQDKGKGSVKLICSPWKGREFWPLESPGDSCVSYRLDSWGAKLKAPIYLFFLFWKKNLQWLNSVSGAAFIVILRVASLHYLFSLLMIAFDFDCIWFWLYLILIAFDFDCIWSLLHLIVMNWLKFVLLWVLWGHGSSPLSTCCFVEHKVFCIAG